MTECLIIADDLTGANATGVLFKKMNYSALTLFDNNEYLSNKDYDCIVLSTDSRSSDKTVAYKRVYSIVEKFKKDTNIKLFSKRIDSTFRGNIGYEIDAMLDSLGKDYIAIVAPCFPSSGRTIVGGYLLVDGVQLNKTSIAIDPKCPISESKISRIIKAQTKNKVSSLYLNDLNKGENYVLSKVKTLLEKESRILIFDCISQEDLDMIADIVLKLNKKIITVDPGVFTATMAKKIISPINKIQSKILCVVGSVNPVTRLQMEKVWDTQNIVNCFVKTENFIISEERRKKEIERVVKIVLSKKDAIVSITGDGIYQKNRIDFEYYEKELNYNLEQITNIINDSFAEIVNEILKKDNSYKGLYTSGGDITTAVCRKLGSKGIKLIDEVLPLAAYGKYINGDFDGLQVITKGGSQGDENAIVDCINYLKEKINM